MAKNAKIAKTEKTTEDVLEKKALELRFCPEPTYRFHVGERVRVGNLKNCVVARVSSNGKAIMVEHDARDPKKGGRETTIFPFHSVRKTEGRDDAAGSFVRNEDVRFSFSNQSISSLLIKALDFGVDFDPPYQRGLEWSDEDREKLIDSIFANVEIGKFVFIERPWTDSESPSYEILDGKQRLTAIVDYYLDRFEYRGKTFSELSPKDQDWFRNYPVAVATCHEGMTERQKARYFLTLNVTGVSVSEERLRTIAEWLEATSDQDEEITNERRS